MIRHAVKSMSAAAVLALSTAGPAVACTQPTSASNPQAQPGAQSQQVSAKFADPGYAHRWHHHHHRFWDWQNQQQAPSSSQQAAQAQDQSSQGQQGGNCNH
jgi:hypothetical protein